MFANFQSVSLGRKLEHLWFEGYLNYCVNKLHLFCYRHYLVWCWNICLTQTSTASSCPNITIMPEKLKLSQLLASRPRCPLVFRCRLNAASWLEELALLFCGIGLYLCSSGCIDQNLTQYLHNIFAWESAGFWMRSAGFRFDSLAFSEFNIRTRQPKTKQMHFCWI